MHTSHLVVIVMGPDTQRQFYTECERDVAPEANAASAKQIYASDVGPKSAQETSSAVCDADPAAAVCESEFCEALNFPSFGRSERHNIARLPNIRRSTKKFAKHN